MTRKTVEDRARELDELIRTGELTETSSVNSVRRALRCSPENAKKALEIVPVAPRPLSLLSPSSPLLSRARRLDRSLSIPVLARASL